MHSPEYTSNDDDRCIIMQLLQDLEFSWHVFHFRPRQTLFSAALFRPYMIRPTHHVSYLQYDVTNLVKTGRISGLVLIKVDTPVRESFP